MIIGVGARISRHLKRWLNKPPLSGLLSRRLNQRTGSVLKDIINGRDAQLLLPVSSFDGANSVVSYNVFNDLTELKVITSINHRSSSSNGHILTTDNGAIGCFETRLSTSGYIQLVRRGIAVIASSINNVEDGDIIEVYYKNSSYEWGILINGVVNNSGVYDADLSLNGVHLVGSRSNTGNDETFNGDLFNTSIYGVKNGVESSLHIPLPHLGYGFNESGEKIDLTIVGNVIESFEQNGSLHLIEKGCIKRESEILPNNNQGLPIEPLIEGDTLIESSSFINNTPFQLQLFESGQTDPEYSFFNKDNIAIWEGLSGGGIWSNEELTQQFIYDNIQNAEKYKLWIKRIGNNTQIKDLFLYSEALEDENIDKAKIYVGVQE